MPPLTGFPRRLVFFDWQEDRLLLHQLGAVPARGRQVRARGHRAHAVHPHYLRLRLDEEAQAVLLRRRRRHQKREEGTLREGHRPQEEEPQPQDTPGRR